MPERRPYVAGNWKMFKTRHSAARFVQEFVKLIPNKGSRPADVGLCVPFTAIEAVAGAAAGAGLGIFAQTMHQASEGAFTGEVSPAMLRDAGATGVVLGHSERRQFFGETDAALKEKVPAALAHGLEPILCIGESEEERESGDTERRLRQQVQDGLSGLEDALLHRVVLAYEPIWAIGTGQTATPDQAQEAISFARALVADRSPEAAEHVRVLYGGSVNAANAPELLALPDVDGALVGGASLEPADLAAIVASAR